MTKKEKTPIVLRPHKALDALVYAEALKIKALNAIETALKGGMPPSMVKDHVIIHVSGIASEE